MQLQALTSYSNDTVRDHNVLTARVAPYREVRALERGLLLINTLGEIGWAGPAVLAERTGIDRSTIYRLLATLERSGFIVSRPQDSKYFLSPRIRELSYGIQEADQRVKLTSDPMRRLVNKINWPSDFAVLTGGHMTIIDSTHPLTTMTFFRSAVGLKRPILLSALGRAIVAGMSEGERSRALERISMGGGPEAEAVRDDKVIRGIVENFERRGYAISSGEVTENISAIALPVRSAGLVVGGLNIVFFRSAFNANEIAAGYLGALQHCVKEIEQAFEAVSNLPAQDKGELTGAIPGMRDCDH